MKWITHQTAGVGAALALHLPLEGVVAACLGAILPDKLDQAIAKRSRNPQRTFNQIHRGTTHWFGWWVAILLVACSHLVPPHWQPALLGIGLGGISHVVLDMLTPSGIPLHPFSRKNKLSFKVCSTGSVGEYVFLGVMLVLLGFLLGPEMKELIRHVRQLGMPVLQARDDERVFRIRGHGGKRRTVHPLRAQLLPLADERQTAAGKRRAKTHRQGRGTLQGVCAPGQSYGGRAARVLLR